MEAHVIKMAGRNICSVEGDGVQISHLIDRERIRLIEAQ